MADPFIGEVKLVGFNFAPIGWAFCDGSLLPISQFDAFFALIGTIYGGDGQTVFGLPDLRGRVPIHQSNINPIGSLFGTESSILTSSQMPIHGHQMHVSSARSNASGPIGNYLSAASTANLYGSSGDVTMNTSSLTGGGQPHENRQPFTTINYIIALEGIFPSQG